MPKKLKTPYYAIASQTKIYGIGVTAREAWSHAANCDLIPLHIYVRAVPCTAACYGAARQIGINAGVTINSYSRDSYACLTGELPDDLQRREFYMKGTD